MFRDVKRQAGVAGFLHQRAMAPYQDFREHPAAALLRSQERVFHGGKTVRLN
jgi:hypothetical protein